MGHFILSRMLSSQDHEPSQLWRDGLSNAVSIHENSSLEHNVLPIPWLKSEIHSCMGGYDIYYNAWGRFGGNLTL